MLRAMYFQTAAAAQAKANEPMDQDDKSGDGSAQENDSDAGSVDEEGGRMVVSANHGKGRGKKVDKSDEILEERSDMLRSISQSVSYMANKKNEKPQREEITPHHTWAGLLALKVIEMDARIRERFKVKVDILALDAIEGKWEPDL